MKKHPVSSLVVLRNSSTSLMLIAGIVTATGCADLADPGASTDESAQVIIDEPVPSTALLSEVRVERTSRGDALEIVSPGWQQIAPGVWDSDIAGTIVIDAAPAKTLEHIARLDHIAPLAVSCTISVYTGPISSAPFAVAPTGIGAFGFAQARCTGGVAVFTVSASACTDTGCNSSSFQIKAGPPGTPGPDGFGVFARGTLGASCSAAASVTPSGINQSRVFPCS